MPSLNENMREACEHMGFAMHSSNWFVRQAIEWLGDRGEVILSEDDGGWCVETTGVCAVDNDSLPGALAAAVMATAVLEEVGDE